MKVVPLFYLTNVAYGGFVTYTAQLARCLRAAGDWPMLYRQGKRDSRRERPWAYGVGSMTMTVGTMCDEVRAAGRGLITCAYWRTHAEATAALLEAGADIMLHDHTEMVPELMQHIAKLGRRVVAIREVNARLVRERGVDRVTYVPHLWLRTAKHVTRPPQRTERSTCLSRVDFDKSTHMVVAAYDMLEPSVRERCHLWGAINRIYAHHKLEAQRPGWQAAYHRGTFPKHPDAAVRIAMSADYVVDMSTIKGDGGGTQSTFFEAWDGGAVLVLHEGWILPDGELQPGVNCLAVSSAAELAAVLASPPAQQDKDRLAAGAELVFATHSPSSVVPQLKLALGWP